MSRSTNDPRLKAASIGFLGLVAVAAYSQGRVQVFDRDDTLARARESQKFTLSRTEYAKRGRILGSDGRPLAQDEDTFRLNIDFRKVPHTDAFFADLSAATGIPASEFSNIALSGTTSREWKRALSDEQADQVQRVKAEWRADGVSIGRTGMRAYPLAEAASCLIGNLVEGKPTTGLEFSQNDLLSGRNGVKIGLTDRTGAFLPMRLDSRSVSKVDGQDITLTIDTDLQEVASNAIRKAVEENKAERGTALVMDPKTGDILAMANWPSFDPTIPGGKAPGMQETSQFNVATMAVLEPGSTFKILTLAKAMDMNLVKPNEILVCKGTKTVGKRLIKCDLHHGTRAMGPLTPEDAIAKSCNVAAATWALRIGYPDMVSYMEQLGLLKKPDLGLPGVQAGLFNRNDPAKQLQLANVGFGQAVNMTPVTLVNAFSILANDGIRMEPRLIAKKGSVEIPPRIAGRIIGQEAAERVLGYMKAVIESDEGTGKSLRIPGYDLAGKTGTAQRLRGGRQEGFVSNFVGFVPAKDPRAVVLVMVDHPQNGNYYGASVAGPVFVDLARSIIRRFAIPPTNSSVRDNHR